MTARLTPAQRALAMRLVKAGPRGLDVNDLSDLVLTGLMRRNLAGVRAGRAVFTGKTKKVQTGVTVRTVLDLSDPSDGQMA